MQRQSKTSKKTLTRNSKSSTKSQLPHHTRTTTKPSIRSLSTNNKKNTFNFTHSIHTQLSPLRHNALNTPIITTQRPLNHTNTKHLTLISQSTRSFALNLTTVNSATTTAPPAPPVATEAPKAASTRPRPTLKSPLTITPSAQNRVIEICSSQDPPAKGIRLGVRTRGCSGLSYTMNFTDGPLSKLEEQVLIPNTDIKIYIDNKALLYVIGTTMDWSETDVAAEFTFNNPNSKGSCGCGESFTV